MTGFDQHVNIVNMQQWCLFRCWSFMYINIIIWINGPLNGFETIFGKTNYPTEPYTPIAHQHPFCGRDSAHRASSVAAADSNHGPVSRHRRHDAGVGLWALYSWSTGHDRVRPMQGTRHKSVFININTLSFMICFTSLRPCWSIKRGQWQPLTSQNTVDSILLYFSIYLVKARMEQVYATTWRSAVCFIYSMFIFNV